MTMNYYYNNKIGEKFLEGLRKGMPQNTAAKYARVPPSTMQSWLDAGERGEDPVLRKLFEDAGYTEAVYTAEKIIPRLENDPNNTWKHAQAYNKDFNLTRKVDIKQDTVELDLFNKDKMVANLEEIVRERKKREN